MQSSANGIQLCKLIKFDDKPPIVSHTILINSDATWSAYVRDIPIHPILSKEYPLRVTSFSIKDLLKEVDEYTICSGNPDHNFVQMLEKRRCKKILSKNGKSVKATLDHNGLFCNNQFYSVTVRVVTCKLATKESRCASCATYKHIH